MLKYRGMYRVIYEIDKFGKVCEETYIPCGTKKGSNICRYSDTVLSVYITSSIAANNLLKNYPNLFRSFQMGDGEGTLLFKESDIENVAEILRIQTRGRCQNPKPKRKSNMSKEQRKIASDRMKKMQLYKKR